MGNDRLVNVAGAVADGRTVDWEVADRSAASDHERQILTELRFIAGIARGTGPSRTDYPAAPDAAAQLPASRPLTEWGTLRLLELVGRGTFGDVYRAWDGHLDREVALKVLRRTRPDSGAADPSMFEEGRLLARIRHPNVVTVYGADRIGREVGVWMEFVRGRTLEQELQERGPFPLEEVIAIGVQVSDALAAIHRAGVLHRDVKTHNIIRDAEGRLILTDLGAGCEVDPRAGGASAELAGTPLYLAPEVLAGHPATPQSDVYSLGVVLFRLITGSYPVSGRSLDALRKSHERRAPTRLGELRPDLPARFIEIIDRALDPDAHRRCQDAAHLCAALGRLTRGPQGGATTGIRPHGWTRRSIIVGAAVLITLAGAAWQRWRASPPPVIAVLPFENLNADNGRSDYFVDGLTDEIIQNLSVIDGLTVRSRTSSFLFKGKPRNLRDIGGRLDANLILEGSVLRSGGRVRIYARLVRAADDIPVWSDRFDREPKDLFAVQDEISRSIVNALRLTLDRGQRRYDIHPEAYDLYLKAIARLHTHDPAAIREAVTLLEQVTSRDQAFAPAFAGLADAWNLLSMNYAGIPPREGYARMRLAAERAAELDPLLAEAQAAMGLVLARDRDWAESEARFRRAIALNANSTRIRINLAVWSLFAQARTEEALRELAHALANDPLSPDLRHLMCWLQVSARRFDEAIANCSMVLAREPEHLHARMQLARSLFQKGDTAQAIAMFEALGAGASGDLGHAYALTGRRAEARRLADENAAFPARLVLIYAGLDEKREVFEALERMASAGEPRIGHYLTSPELSRLHGDPRLATLRRTIGLPAQ